MIDKNELYNKVSKFMLDTIRCSSMEERDELEKEFVEYIYNSNNQIGITEAPEKQEDLPPTITVITQDFINLITIAGSLCHPKAPIHYKKRMENEIRKIALRHHINYVGEIKE